MKDVCDYYYFEDLKMESEVYVRYLTAQKVSANCVFTYHSFFLPPIVFEADL
jgi:hypothetical protein